KLADLEDKIEIISAEIRATESLREPLSRSQIVYHLAAIDNRQTCEKDFPLAFDVNTKGTANVLSLCSNVERVVFASSTMVASGSFSPVRSCTMESPGKLRTLPQKNIAPSRRLHFFRLVVPSSRWQNSTRRYESVGQAPMHATTSPGWGLALGADSSRPGPAAWNVHNFTSSSTPTAAASTSRDENSLSLWS
ncbi:MAG: NAD(P)-dependent oxidoreductase, partial [Planctomycetes bacterium]|nr:NAD(P)-dependent oxidoreductase [Planctomycetota bacterium]